MEDGTVKTGDAIISFTLVLVGSLPWAMILSQILIEVTMP
jgi:hypothetical protein